MHLLGLLLHIYVSIYYGYFIVFYITFTHVCCIFIYAEIFDFSFI